MSRMARILLVAALVSLAVAVTAGPAMAGPGRNNGNAKTCQKGGWEAYFTTAGAAFASEKACTSYGAQGGVYVDACTHAGGTPEFFPPPDFTGDAIYWCIGVNVEADPANQALCSAWSGLALIWEPDAVLTPYTGCYERLR